MLVADMLNVLEIYVPGRCNIYCYRNRKKSVVIQFQYYQIAAAWEGGAGEWIIVFLSAASHNKQPFWNHSRNNGRWSPDEFPDTHGN